MKSETHWTERHVTKKQNTAKVRPCDGRQEGHLYRLLVLELGLVKGLWGEIHTVKMHRKAGEKLITGLGV